MPMLKASSKTAETLLLDYQMELRNIEVKLQKNLYQLPNDCPKEELPYIQIRFQKMLQNIKQQRNLCKKICNELT